MRKINKLVDWNILSKWGLRVPIGIIVCVITGWLCAIGDPYYLRDMAKSWVQLIFEYFVNGFFLFVWGMIICTILRRVDENK